MVIRKKSFSREARGRILAASIPDNIIPNHAEVIPKDKVSILATDYPLFLALAQYREKLCLGVPLSRYL